MDGGVTKTAHINLAIKQGADLVICINPLVPIHNGAARSSLGPLSGHGVDTVLGRVLRILLHGRFEYGMDRYRTEHPDIHILLIEPTRDDLTMFRYDIMRYSARKALARHGRVTALETLRDRKSTLAKTLAKHGVRFRVEPTQGRRPETHREEHEAQSSQKLASSLDALERSLVASR